MSAKLAPAAAAPERAADRWIDAVVLALTLGFLALQFPPRLLFAPTVTAGGDTPSHYYTLLYLKDVLLPQGRLSGWSPSHFAGFPILEFYFPVPFLFMAALSVVIPATIAFKLGTILGIFLLPLGAYGCLRALRVPFPGPALAAVAVLPFLFSEGSSMWGGNIPSVLAGEFAYSLGLALAVWWVGLAHAGITTGTRLGRNALLLAVIGLTHGYSLVWAGTASLFFLLHPKTFFTRAGYLLKMYALAILLMSGWLIPALAHSPWVTPFEFTWDFNSWKEVLPIVMIPVLVLAGATMAWEIVRLWTRQRPHPAAAYVLVSALAGVVLFLISPTLGIVDVRFIPFTYVALALLAALGLGHAAQRLAGKRLVPLLALALTCWWVGWQMRSIPAWVTWNYSGFEAKPSWPVHAQITKTLQGSFNDPRVLYEHSLQHDALGSIRVWESLPVFSGRATLEHAYFQASPSAPFVFYLQSEMSKQVSCPFPEYGCATYEPERLVSHLDLFNIRELIIISDEMKARLKAHPSFERLAVIPPYDLYQLRGPHHYVVPLQYEPVLWTGGRWKETAYAWFRNIHLAGRRYLVFPVGKHRPDARLLLATTDDLAAVPAIPLAPADAVQWERISNDRVEFETTALGAPHLIKVSYHPNWRVEGAEGIFLVSPAFMLVYPTQSRVRLTYTRSMGERVGWLLSFVTLGWLLLRRRRPSRAARRRRAGRARRQRWAWRATILGLTGTAAVWALIAASIRLHEPPALLAKINRASQEKRWADVERDATVILEQAPQSMQAEYAAYQLGISHYLRGQWEPAIRAFTRLVTTLPDSRLAAEAYWHLALCYDALGNAERRQAMQAALEQDFPQSSWAGYARDRWPAAR